MMTTMKRLTAGLVMLLCAPLALAEGKIVVLDLQAAVLSTDVAQRQLAALEQNEDYAALLARYENLESDIEAFQEDAQRNSMTWSEEQQQQKQQEMQQLRESYERAVQQLQGARQQVMQGVMQQMGGTTQDVLEKLIEEENIGLVLNSQSAFHASSAYDITDQVRDLINKAIN